MRKVLTILATAVVCAGLASFGAAEDKKGSDSTDAGKVQGRSETESGADLRAEIHRTLAQLIEARAAEKPDQAKVDELTGKLRQLRGEFRGQVPAGNAADGWACPRGGPGKGFGCCRGCPGGGRGRGAGFGPGAGRGWGGGAGGGRGLGPGGGQGRAPGGAAFLDQDQDGTCDRFEQRSSTQK